MNYTHCEMFKDNVKYQCDDSTMYEFDNGYGAIVEYNKSVDNLWITIIKDIDGHGFNYAYPDFAHGFCRITGVKVYHLILWLQQINEIKGGHKMTNLDTLKQQTADLEAKLEETTEKLKSMKAEINRLENGWKMKCPYKDGDDYWILSSFGSIQKMEWTNNLFDELALMQGNTFPTQEAIELEIKRRNLLTRFNAFRDECNNGWEHDWNDVTHKKYYVFYSEIKKDVCVTYIVLDKRFHTFGYFKNGDDAYKAIELFGDEIKELFVEGE